MAVDAGERDRRVLIQQRSATDSATSSGQPAETWSTLDTVWMRKRDLRQLERFSAGQATAPVDTEWVMEYRDDMDPELIDVVKVRRLVFSGFAYDIVSAVHLGMQEGIAILTLGRTAIA